MFCLSAVGLLFLIVLSIPFAKYTVIYLYILHFMGMWFAFSWGMQLFLTDYIIKNISVQKYSNLKCDIMDYYGMRKTDNYENCVAAWKM